MPGKSTNGIDYEQAVRPLAVMPKEDPDAHVVLLHQYARGQLICAVAGVMEIESDNGLWPMPPREASCAFG